MRFLQWLGSPSGIRKVNMVLIVLLGLFMIGMSIAGTIITLEEPLIDVDWSFALMTVYAYAGVVIVLSANRSPRVAIFMGGIAFAVMNLIQQIVIITNVANVPSAILSAIMDFVMIICSILCLIGDRHSALRLLAICAIQFATVFTAHMLDVLEFTDMFGYTTLWWMTIECLFLLIFMFLLLRPGIREETVKKRIRKGINVVSSKMVTGPSASIGAKDVAPLVGEDMSRWRRNRDTDRIESEYRAVVHEEGRVSYLISYKWAGEDDIRMAVASDTKIRPYGSGFVLRDHSIEEIDDVRYLRLYGDEGLFFRLLIDETIPSAEEDDDEFTDPIEYISDKIITG